MVHAPTGDVMLFVSRVSAAFCAIARPSRMLAPVFIVMLVNAMMLP
jgi:hypothetical protein